MQSKASCLTSTRTTIRSRRSYASVPASRTSACRRFWIALPSIASDELSKCGVSLRRCGGTVHAARREHERVPPVQILVINCGSSSLKFELILMAPHAAGTRRLVQGTVERIGRASTATLNVSGSIDRPEIGAVTDHGSAIRKVIEWLREGDRLAGAAPDAVGHRVVHGGPRLFEPTVIDERVIREIAEASQLAPLHNGSALQAIAASRELLGAAVPMVAVFDTAFHHDMPERASRYAIPPATADEHGIRRYGFHGLAHRYMAERCAELLARPVQSLRLITLQLGGGCSAAAVRGGRSVDTSMGFTPLEGLVMG